MKKSVKEFSVAINILEHRNSQKNIDTKKRNSPDKIRACSKFSRKKTLNKSSGYIRNEPFYLTRNISPLHTKKPFQDKKNKNRSTMNDLNTKPYPHPSISMLIKETLQNSYANNETDIFIHGSNRDSQVIDPDKPNFHKNESNKT